MPSLARWFHAACTRSPTSGSLSSHSGAAGNCAVLKPSEFAPHTGAAIARLIGEIFPLEFVAVVQGDESVAAAMLREKFQRREMSMEEIAETAQVIAQHSLGTIGFSGLMSGAAKFMKGRKRPNFSFAGKDMTIDVP